MSMEGSQRRPSRCAFLRASLRARRMASAFSRAFFSDGFLVMLLELHLTKNAFTLKLLLQRAERLIDIVVANTDLHSGCHHLSRFELGSKQEVAL
jgi:hypothetical protein